MAYELVTPEEARSYLKLAEVPADLPMLITNLSARVEAHCGLWFVAREVTEVLDANGHPQLFLTHFPIQGTPTVTDLPTGEAVTDFFTYHDRGMLYRVGGWPAGLQRFQVAYTAGICPDTASVPADVKQAALEWIAARYARRDSSVKRESIGAYSYAVDEPDGMPAGVRAALSLYRMPRGW